MLCPQAGVGAQHGVQRPEVLEEVRRHLPEREGVRRHGLQTGNKTDLHKKAQASVHTRVAILKFYDSEPIHNFRKSPNLFFCLRFAFVCSQFSVYLTFFFKCENNIILCALSS